jgi:NADH-quinone oxidoreductase subunit N
MNVAENAAVSARLAEILPSFEFYLHAAPVLVLLVGSMAALLVGIFRSDPEKPSFTSFGIAISSVLAAILLPFIVMSFGSRMNLPVAYLGSGFLADGLTKFSFIVIGLVTLVTLFSASLSDAGRMLLRSELVSLLLMSSAGMMMMVAAGEFLSFFIGLELTSLPLYILVGYQRRTVSALEGALKYFFLGATAAAFILMGMALVYLKMGSLRWEDLSGLTLSKDDPFTLLGMFLMLVGLGFKLALAPFHGWAPDVYQSSHSTLAGYMASLVKFSVAIVLIRILSSFSSGTQPLVSFFWITGALSIVIGSCFGLVHNSVKRMLAYSSIANAGYLCLGFAVLANNPADLASKQALVAYAAVYCLLSVGAFAVLAWLEDGNNEDLLKEELAGLGSRNPIAAVTFTIFMFGLAGIPPLAGFFGKFMLVSSAVSQGMLGLSIIMVLASCFSLYYYLSLLVQIWFKPASRMSVVPGNAADVLPQKYLAVVLAGVSIIVGVIGPRWSQSVHFKMAKESSKTAKVGLGMP